MVTLTANKAVTATFALDTHTLSTSTEGNGSGTLSLDPPGGSYDYGTVVTVTATPDTGSYLAAWGGDCSGTGICSLTMNGDKSVTATFTLNTYIITPTEHHASRAADR
jgi:hypothetical protein